MLTSSEFFINVKRKPTLDSDEYDSFYQNEFNKIENGITVGGIYYPGWLYWHLNHWKIFVDKEPDPRYPSKMKKAIENPQLRDNEWIISNHFEKAENFYDTKLGRIQKKGLLLVGSRRFAKTEILASRLAYNAITIFGSENMYAASNDTDLNKISASLKRGFKELDPYFKPIFLEDSWKAGSNVVLGFKDVAGERNEYSQLLIRNHNEGRNTEAGAGATLSSFAIDEIGKSKWRAFFNSIKPAFDSEFGWRCSPLATGTTGNMTKAKELEEVYKHMEAANFISIELKDDNDKSYKFFPGQMSLKFQKKEVPLKEFIGKPELPNKDTIKITKWDWATELLIDEVEEWEKKGEYNEARSVKMFYPKDEDEMFLTDDSENPFADVVDYAREHLNYLETIQPNDDCYRMVRDENGKAKAISSTDQPIKNYPTEPWEDRDAPIIIWSHPIKGQEFGILHVAGSDPYNHDEVYNSPSLGTLYIYRRTYDPINGTMQESFVASLAARPKSLQYWRDQVRLLLEYYDCTLLPEAEEGSFIRWFDENNIGHYLEEGISIAREINPKTKTQRTLGLQATDPNIRYGNGLLRNYCIEDIQVGRNEDGSPIMKKGVVRIKDKVLLREIISYRPGANADRIVGARHALILAKSKNKIHPLAKIERQYTEKDIRKKPVKSPFVMVPKTGLGRKRSPFTTLR